MQLEVTLLENKMNDIKKGNNDSGMLPKDDGTNMSAPPTINHAGGLVTLCRGVVSAGGGVGVSILTSTTCLHQKKHCLTSALPLMYAIFA